MKIIGNSAKQVFNYNAQISATKMENSRLELYQKLSS